MWIAITSIICSATIVLLTIYYGRKKLKFDEKKLELDKEMLQFNIELRTQEFYSRANPEYWDMMMKMQLEIMGINAKLDFTIMDEYLKSGEFVKNLEVYMQKIGK